MSWTARKFAHSLIHGAGGFRRFEQDEIVNHKDRDVAIAEWTLRCLAYPGCEGSQDAIAAILSRRKRIESGEEPT